jgi:hypothetical protein
VQGTLTIPDSVIELGVETTEWGTVNGHTFAYSGITNVIIGKGLTELVPYMFYNCRSLSEVVIPSNIKNIREAAFHSCVTLTTVRIEEGVETIGDYVFVGCNLLSDVYIPRSVTNISAGAFGDLGCTIHGYAGSYAEQYATQWNYNFEVIEE